MVNSFPEHKDPTKVVVTENAFCQGMVVLLNPVCILLFGMFHVYKSKVRVAVFFCRKIITIWKLAYEITPQTMHFLVRHGLAIDLIKHGSVTFQ